jgi:hypothetical protein
MRGASGWWVATLGVALCGCGPSAPEYDYLFLRDLTNPPAPAVVHPRQIELMEDTAAAFQSWPVSGNEIAYTEDDVFLLQSRDVSVMEVLTTTDDYQWVVHGVAPGKTCIEIVVLDVVEDCVPAKTTAQP